MEKFLLAPCNVHGTVPLALGMIEVKVRQCEARQWLPQRLRMCMAPRSSPSGWPLNHEQLHGAERAQIGEGPHSPGHLPGDLRTTASGQHLDASSHPLSTDAAGPICGASFSRWVAEYELGAMDTSVIRPTTRSPTSALYLFKHEEVS